MIFLKTKNGKLKKYEKAAAVDKYFEEDAIHKAKNQNSMSREKMFYMKVDDFLALARGGFDPAKERTVELLLRDKVPLSSIPYLNVENDLEKTEEVKPEHSADNWRVTGHEGRHRARALAQLGFKVIPVVIKHRTMRWDKSKTKPTYVWAQSPKDDALLYDSVFKE